MAVKTITVTEEAYHALAAQKREGESFTRTILRLCPSPGTSSALIAARRELANASHSAECERRMQALLAQRAADREGAEVRMRFLRGEE